jgi:hypothetical protein
VIVVIIALLVLVARFICRSLSFPGSLPPLRRDIEGEYGKFTLKKIHSIIQDIDKVLSVTGSQASLSSLQVSLNVGREVRVE